MKRRIWLLSFLICFVMFSLSGCDFDLPNSDDRPKTKKELVEALFWMYAPKTTEVPTPEPTPTATVAPTPSPTPSPTPTPVPTATPIPTPTPTPTPIDWSKEYDDYFRKEQLLPANYRIETTLAVEGVEAQVSLAQTETFCHLSLGVGNTTVHVYTNEIMAFLCKQDKKGEEWCYTRLDQDADLSEILGIDISMDFGISGDIVIGQVYQGNVVEEEKIYDIIDIVTSQIYGKIKLRLYINRDTQKIDKVQTLYEGQEIVVYLWEIDPIELPKGSAYAKSTTKEDFSEKYKKAILQGAASAIGGKLWSDE